MSCKRTARRPPRKLRIRIDSLAFGGDGVGKDEDGRVVFVPGTTPGDEVEVTLLEEKKGYARAELARVLVASPDRVTPPCPLYLAGCGGCQWQHVAVGAQRAAKEEIVRRALRHTGVTVAPIETPAPDYGWRRRSRLRYRRGVVGYVKRRSHELLDVPSCPQLEPALDAALGRLRGELAGRLDGSGALHLLLGGRGDVHAVLEPGPSEGEIDLADDARPFLARADVFVQVSAPGNATLRRLVREAVGELAGKRVLELYAGSGNFTRDLGGATEVVAVEESADAVAFGRRNAPEATWRNEAATAPPEGRFDVVVMDPPRTGLEDGLAGTLARLGAERIVYVSCDPNTLARDVAALAGYRVEKATPVDLMPQTYHVEIVVLLVRAASAAS